MTRAAAALALAALATACSLGRPPGPTLESVSPDRTRVGTSTDVTVRGAGFTPRVRADLDDPGASTVAPYDLALVHEGARVQLEAVVVVSDRELTARVPPVATPAAYDLVLVDALGRTARLPAAFTVEPEPGCGPDGTPCDDGNVCTVGDACLAGVCAPGPSVCANTAPFACLAVTPASAAPGDAITVDASCSTDGEDAGAALQARFDLDGDGAFDTPFAPISTARTIAFATAGTRAPAVEVVDSGGLSDVSSRLVVVTAATDRVLVTTTADEGDAGATPAAPGGTGLSLREAIAWVNGLPAGAPRTIAFAVSGPIVHGSALPALRAPAAAIVATADVPLEFPGVTLPCVTLEGPSQLLLGATVSGCTATAVQLVAGSDGSRVAECTITPAPTAHGIVAKAPVVIGPRNVVSGADRALKLNGASSRVEDNLLWGNQTGISALSSVELRVVRNRIASNWGHAIETTPSSATCTLLHNVFDANGGDGVSLPVNGGCPLRARNNLFTRNGGYGVRLGSTAAALDHNGFFGNALGALSRGSPDPAADVLADPLYAGDHRLAPGSPAIDRGVDADPNDPNLDLNGPAVGRWNGAAPDVGVWESPYSAPAP